MTQALAFPGARRLDIVSRYRWALADARLGRVAALGLVAIAAFLRLGAFDIVPFKLDEADALARVRALVDHGVLPANGGHMSWGLPDPPLVIYLLAVPAAFTRDAAVAAAFMGMLDLIAVILTYRLGAQMFGRRVGLAAGLLYATCPWAIYYGREVWVNIVPAFTAVALYAAMQVVAQRRPRWALVFFLAIGAQSQTHLLAAVLVVPTLLTVALFPRRWLSPFSLLGLGLAALISAPYLLGTWERRFELVEIVRTQLGSSQSAAASALELSLWAVSGFHLQDLLGPGEWADYAVFTVALGVVFAAVCVLVAIGTWRCLVATARRTTGWEAHLLLLCWAWTPVAVLAMARSSLSLHYFTMLYPALFLIAGLGLRGPGLPAWRAPARLWGAIAQPALVTIGVAQTAALVALVLLLRRAELGGAVGLPFGTWSSIAGQAREVATRVGSTDVRVLTRGTDATTEDYPAALAYALGPELRTTFVRAGSLALPGNGPAYVHVLGDTSGDALMGRLGQPQMWLSLPGGREWARVFLVPACTPEAAAALPSRPRQVALTHGLHFLGVDSPDAARAGEPVSVTTYWRLSGIGPAEWSDDLTIFHHLVDARGRIVAQRDGIGIPSWRWRDGDVLIESSALPLPGDTPPGTYQLQGGLYSRRDLHRARRLDDDANSLKLGEVRVGQW